MYLPLWPTGGVAGIRRRALAGLLAISVLNAGIAQDAGPAPSPVDELVSFASGAPEIDAGRIDHVLHVSPSGNDATADGTLAFPYNSVTAALSRAAVLNQGQSAGIKVLVAPGTYRVGAVAEEPGPYFPHPEGGRPIILEGAGWSPGTLTGDVILTGAEPLTGWVDNGDGTWTAFWPHDLGEIDPATIGDPPSLPEAYPKRDGLFVDGIPYYQFAGAADPTLANRTAEEGAFWVDTVARTLTAWPPDGSDFAAAVTAGTIEGITRIRAFYGWRIGSLAGIPAPIAIRNIRFERFGEYALRFQNSNGLIIEDCEFLQCRHYGLLVTDSANNTIRRVRINDNGVTGLGHQADNGLVEDIQLNRNGRQAMLNRFLGWGYGGMKIGNSAGVTYRRWEVRDSEGVGVWFDTGLVEVDFSDSVITGSKTASIFVENSNTNTLTDLGERTTLWLRELYIADSIGEPGATDGKGIQFAASENVTVEDCVIDNSDWLLNFPSDSRGPQRNIVLRRNVVASPANQPFYYVAYGTNGWRESGAFPGIEGAFDTFSASTNDNAYFNFSSTGFRNRSMASIGFTGWKQAHLDNGLNPHADRAVDSRSTFATGGYSGQPLVVVRPVTASWMENGGTVAGFAVSRVADNTTGDLVVAYSLGGTAVAGVHYAALSGSVVIPDGARSIRVPVSLLDNGPGDPDRVLSLHIEGSPEFFCLSGPASFTILDDPILQGNLLVERHGLSLWQGTGGPRLEFLLVRNTAATYPLHAIEAGSHLQPDGWSTIWNSDGTIGSGNLIETSPLEGGLEQLRIRDPQHPLSGQPRFLRLRQD